MLGFSTNLPGQPRMLDVLRDGLSRADEVALSIAFVRYSGLQLLVENLCDFTERGGRARVLTSTYLGVTQPEALRALAAIPGVCVRLHVAQNMGARGFHPKFAIFDGADACEAWVGSSNMTKGGLCTNVEANIRQRDPRVIDHVRQTFDRLWEAEHTFDLSANLTDAYARALLRQYEARRPRETLTFDLATAQAPTPNIAQSEALASLARLRAHGESKAVVVAAPGVGKTFLAAFDAAAAGATSLLFVSHRLEHLAQAKKTFAAVFGDTRSTGLLYGDVKQTTADFVFATVQSALNSDALARRRFDYMVVDEFHHASAPSYRALLESLNPGFLLGLTATPERQDGHDILALCDFNVAYEMRLVDAINRDLLVPFHYFGIADETVDYSQSFWRSKNLDVHLVEDALMLEARVDHILEHAQQRGYDGVRRATVGFCVGRRHARFMAEALIQRGFCAAALTGEDDLERRQTVFRRFEDPEDPLEWLFVADLLNEGVDIPNINSLLFLRPTQSATIFIQQLGRGLRLSEHCEVLTVLDFVGQHRNAWITIDALSDVAAPRGPSTVETPDTDITPPRHCEVILDRKTIEILRKVQRFTKSKREQCHAVYRDLRQELAAAPFPIDLLGRAGAPTLGEFRSACTSWLDLRKAMGDAADWEKSLTSDSPAYQLLLSLERDWQQQRVYAYALLWGLCKHPDDPDRGYAEFFDRFPRWRVEFKGLDDTTAWATLEKKLGDLLRDRRVDPKALAAIPRDELLPQVERRLQYTLEGDFRTRHGGVLRTPDALELHRGYARPTIINYFGSQYDPTRHNKGVLTFGDDIVIITKLDTSGALEEHQYRNEIIDEETVHWQSQNQQRQDNASGRRILDHVKNNLTIHLFVQPTSHKLAVYLGPAVVAGVDGNAPMDVTFRLRHPISEPVMAMYHRV